MILPDELMDGLIEVQIGLENLQETMNGLRKIDRGRLPSPAADAVHRLCHALSEFHLSELIESVGEAVAQIEVLDE